MCRIYLISRSPSSVTSSKNPERKISVTKDFLDLKIDFMFKQLFGQPSRKHITLAFINDLLAREGTDIEVQVSNQHDMPERILYYWAKSYSSLIHSGENYRQLTPSSLFPF